MAQCQREPPPRPAPLGTGRVTPLGGGEGGDGCEPARAAVASGRFALPAGRCALSPRGCAAASASPAPASSSRSSDFSGRIGRVIGPAGGGGCSGSSEDTMRTSCRKTSSSAAASAGETHAVVCAVAPLDGAALSKIAASPCDPAWCGIPRRVGYRVAWDAASRPIRNATYAVAQTNKCDAIRCERALGQPSTWTKTLKTLNRVPWSTPGVPLEYPLEYDRQRWGRPDLPRR